MIIEVLNGGEIQAQENTEYLVFADSVFVLPASSIKNTIKIKASGVITIGLKFTYPNDTQKTIGMINGKSYKPENIHGSLVYNFTLDDQTEMELKCYKRSINTYWTPYITAMPVNQGLVEDPNPQINLLGLVDPAAFLDLVFLGQIFLDRLSFLGLFYSRLYYRRFCCRRFDLCFYPALAFAYKLTRNCILLHHLLDLVLTHLCSN